MKELVAHDLNWCVNRLPGRLRRLLEDKENPYGDTIIAGGFIRSCIAREELNDVDLFTPTKEGSLALANALAPDRDRAKNEAGLLPGIHATDNAYTIPRPRPTLQVIHRWLFTTPEEAVNSFDFTIARAGIWYDRTCARWKSICAETYYPDLAAKRLIYCSPERIEEVGGSVLRVLKFYQRGYRIPLDSLAAVVARLMSGVKDEKVRNSEGGYDEVQLRKVLSGLLREVDPNVDPAHDAHLPSLES